MWTQEEPKNQGAYPYVQIRLHNLLNSISRKDKTVHYSGRPISASTATGYGKHHTQELDALLKSTFA
jgi:2-oxoglutarate dehydrogenase complex dehydrogenase (E1) component-like enzyme